MFRHLLCVMCAGLLLVPAGKALGQEAAGPVGAAEHEPISLDRDPHLMGWWKLDETADKTAADSSEHHRNATLQGDLSFEDDSVAGKTGKALKLDGKGGFVEVTGYKGVTGTAPRTLAGWIKTTRSRGEIISWGRDDFGRMFIFGFIRGGIGVTPGGGYFYMGARVHDDAWHHVAVVVEEADRPNLHDHVKLYKDGVLQEVHDIGLLDLWPIDTGDELDVRIGRGYEGLLDDVRIYDRPLTGDEVKALAALRTDGR